MLARVHLEFIRPFDVQGQHILGLRVQDHQVRYLYMSHAVHAVYARAIAIFDQRPRPEISEPMYRTPGDIKAAALRFAKTQATILHDRGRDSHLHRIETWRLAQFEAWALSL